MGKFKKGEWDAAHNYMISNGYKHKQLYGGGSNDPDHAPTKKRGPQKPEGDYYTKGQHKVLIHRNPFKTPVEHTGDHKAYHTVRKSESLLHHLTEVVSHPSSFALAKKPRGSRFMMKASVFRTATKDIILATEDGDVEINTGDKLSLIDTKVVIAGETYSVSEASAKTLADCTEELKANKDEEVEDYRPIHLGTQLHDHMTKKMGIKTDYNKKTHRVTYDSKHHNAIVEHLHEQGFEHKDAGAGSHYFAHPKNPDVGITLDDGNRTRGGKKTNNGKGSFFTWKHPKGIHAAVEETAATSPRSPKTKKDRGTVVNGLSLANKLHRSLGDGMGVDTGHVNHSFNANAEGPAIHNHLKANGWKLLQAKGGSGGKGSKRQSHLYRHAATGHQLRLTEPKTGKCSLVISKKPEKE